MKVYDIDTNCMNLINETAEMFGCDADVFIQAIYALCNKVIKDNPDYCLLLNGIVNIIQTKKNQQGD